MARTILPLSLALLALGAGPALAAGPHSWARPAAAELVHDGAWPARAASDLAAPASRRELAAGLRALAGDAEATADPTRPAADHDPTGEFPDRTDTPGEPELTPPATLLEARDRAADEAETDPGLARRARTIARGLERRPGATVSGRLGNRVVVRALGFAEERARLGRLRLGGARLGLPAGFATEILARELGLRHNYPSEHEALERGADEPLRRADVAGMIAAARAVDDGDRFRLSRFRTISLPAAGHRRTTVLRAAVGYVGHVYVWGGDWPDTGSPWGRQTHGGFDCSGLAWMAFKGARPSAALGLGDALGGRVADDMAWEAPGQWIRAEGARAGDLVFFGEPGPRSRRGDITHMGIALGSGWMIHSSGSRAGVSISHLDDYWPTGRSHARRVRTL